MEEGATPEEWVMDRIVSGLYHGCILASDSPRSRILHKLNKLQLGLLLGVIN